MFLKSEVFKQNGFKHKRLNKKQQGSALVMALFIIVVVLMLGTALVKVLQSGEESFAYQVIGTRAYAAANSGAQKRLQELFPLASASLRCGAVNGSGESNNTVPLVSIGGADGLQSCSATVECNDFEYDSVIYYTIKSTGQCGASTDVKTSRTIEIQARSL